MEGTVNSVAPIFTTAINQPTVKFEMTVKIEWHLNDIICHFLLMKAKQCSMAEVGQNNIYSQFGTATNPSLSNYFNAIAQMNYQFLYSQNHAELGNSNALSADKKARLREAKRIEERIGNFDPMNSAACIEIYFQFGKGVSQKHLTIIATNIVNNISGLSLDRDAKRRKGVLLKWFDENWETIKKCINDYKINDEHVYYKGTLIE